MISDRKITSASDADKWQRNRRAFAKWQAFAEKYPDQHLLAHIEQFYREHIAAMLEERVISQLDEYERLNQRDEFMQLLGQQIPNLDWFSRNYYYFRWIRMAALALFDESSRNLLKQIPLFPYPELEQPFARTIERDSGQLILISFTFSMVALSVFQALTIDGMSKMSAKELDSFFNRAADNILVDMRRLFNQEELRSESDAPTPTESQIYYGDLLNNQLHTFVLLHEYNHILLEHLGSDSSGKADIDKDIEADFRSLELLVKSSGSQENQVINMLLVSSIFVFHHLQMINKVMLGYGKQSLKDNETRINMALAYIPRRG